MAREMTSQERAEDLYSSIKASGEGFDDDQATDDLCVEMLKQALQQTRRAALREARQTVSQLFDQQASELPDYYAALLDAGNAIDRLAQEG